MGLGVQSILLRGKKSKNEYKRVIRSNKESCYTESYKIVIKSIK